MRRHTICQLNERFDAIARVHLTLMNRMCQVGRQYNTQSSLPNRIQKRICKEFETIHLHKF